MKILDLLLLTLLAHQATSSTSTIRSSNTRSPQLRSRRSSIVRIPGFLGMTAVSWGMTRERGARGEGVKRTGLSLGEIRDIVQDDFVMRKCLVSGDISKAIYADDCVFTDPQMTCKGLDKFVSGTKALFYAPASELELLGRVEVVGDNQIFARFREVACFNIPFRPKTYFSGNLTLTVRKQDGLIENYLEQWDLSIPEILRSARL
ncbi:hypothetical protein AAMO2058_001026500 [Amorphochlora amoebiformis]